MYIVKRKDINNRKKFLLKQINQKAGNLKKEIENGGERIINNNKDKKEKQFKRNKSNDFPIKKIILVKYKLEMKIQNYPMI